MTTGHRAPRELRERLGDWFVEEMSVIDPDVPVSPPPVDPALGGLPARTRRRRWLVGANVALIVAVLAGLVLVSARDDDRAPVESPPASTAAAQELEPSEPVAAGVIGSLLADVCADLHDAVERLPLGADVADVERIVAPIVAVLDGIDDRLSALPDDSRVEDARSLLVNLDARVADLPFVAATGERESFDRAVANVDLLLAAAGRELEAAGGECADLPTLRARS